MCHEQDISGSAEPDNVETGIAEPGSAEPQLGSLNCGASEDQEKSQTGAQRSQVRGWYSRGYLPHVDFPGELQSITYRLADSLPKEVLSQIEDTLRGLDENKVDATRRYGIEEWLDAGHGSCYLRDPRAASCIIETWQRFAQERYDLIAWVVMPNHVHVLIRVYDGFELSKIVQSWKSYTGRKIAQWMSGSAESGIAEHQLASLDCGVNEKQEKSRAGAQRSQKEPIRVWMREYWDRYIRDDCHFTATVDYIHQNPVKARLTRCAEDWLWSSARKWVADA